MYEQAREMGDEDENGPPEYAHDLGRTDTRRRSRGPSKRQQEKAPEGRAPHEDDTAAGPVESERNGDAGGPAPNESRFTEGL
ncbi:hypothetical protein A0H81_07342 [Grifola frondosa]|uniref:Uncharacterized protein n=1 Tax=Grifola frondosa TaxID=5627 RepID=A0A1C7M5Z5_GRIFR|nr:hypothetical protein A0H81_07342 [Grifola frondosa]